MDEALEGVIERLVTQRLAKMLEPDSVELINWVFHSDVLHKHFREFMESKVGTEIGNRLRCGIYPERRAFDKAFEEAWAKEGDTALKDRVRNKVNAAINEVIHGATTKTESHLTCT